MLISDLKIVINDIIDEYNLDIVLLIGIILLGIYLFFIQPLMFVSTTDAVIDGHIINVTARASGQVLQSYIMQDQEVKKGDLMMEIDVKDYENELIKLETDLEINKEKLRMITNAPLPEDLEEEDREQNKNQTNLPKYKAGSQDFTNYSKTYEPEDLAEKNLERKKIILGDTVKEMSEKQKTEEIEVPKPVIDKSKIDISNDTVDSVKKEIKNIETQKEEVKLRISGAKVFAPRDGIVVAVSVSQGDIVNPSDVLCTITPKQVWVLARVNPEKLCRVQIGQPVKIKVPGYKHRIFKGTITSIDKTAKVYQLKAHEQVEEIGTDGQPVPAENIAYQIKIDFVEDYSDFNLPPDTEVKATIQVKSLLNQM